MGCTLLPPPPEAQRPPRAGTTLMRYRPRYICCLHLPWCLGKVPWHPFPIWGASVLEYMKGYHRLSRPGYLWRHTVIKAERRLRRHRAKPEGALRSHPPASTTWSTARHHQHSKAGGDWKRPERLSVVPASYWLTASFVNLLVGIQKGKAGPCMKARIICMWKLLHLFRIQQTVWRLQTEKKKKGLWNNLVTFCSGKSWGKCIIADYMYNISKSCVLYQTNLYSTSLFAKGRAVL